MFSVQYKIAAPMICTIVFLNVFTFIARSSSALDVEFDGQSFFQGNKWKFEATMGSRARAVVNKVLSVEQAEGVGARVRRSVGGAKVRVLSGK